MEVLRFVGGEPIHGGRMVLGKWLGQKPLTIEKRNTIFVWSIWGKLIFIKKETILLFVEEIKRGAAAIKIRREDWLWFDMELDINDFEN